MNATCSDGLTGCLLDDAPWEGGRAQSQQLAGHAEASAPVRRVTSNAPHASKLVGRSAIQSRGIRIGVV